MKASCITEQELKQFLSDHPKWAVEIKNEIPNLIWENRFPNFLEAFKLITSIALVSEKLDHHCLLINEYNFLKISIHTHETKSITTKDLFWIKSVFGENP
ncbi:4a-hydroxytetrahydrobiopterin dehydratase [Leptospira sp. 96542]|nr:4a-hydroxytetrahydrobiopterin dehydratase [Leptospira sp. 96542]